MNTNEYNCRIRLTQDITCESLLLSCVFQTTLEAVRKYFRCFKPSKCGTLNVLLVDDNLATHESIRFRFKMLNWHLTSVYNGKEALTLYESTRFSGMDLVLMALRMPVLGGQAATEALVRMGCNVPIVVLASGSRNVEVKGAMGVLQKPLQVPQLIKLVLSAHTHEITTSGCKR